VHIDLTTPALLFPAISLLLLAFTNRFLAVANLIRNLHDNYMKDKDKRILGQLKSLRKRLMYIRLMQGFGIGSMFFCVFTMFLLYSGLAEWGNFVFGLSLILMLVSLAMSLMEIQLSSKTLMIHLSDMEENELQSTEPGISRMIKKMTGK
jgi:hypothetical protein